jgi:hypothetical protein
MDFLSMDDLKSTLPRLLLNSKDLMNSLGLEIIV